MITLKTLPLATAQEVFDQVANHLLTQNKKSTGFCGPVDCAYRGENNTKCAAGCLIADDEYVEDMEGDMWGHLVKNGLAPDSHLNLILELQRIHDNFETEEWRIELAELAKNSGLIFKH